jgi:3-hydroxy acid dehydrogenase/malonic semialdehyde reductase
MEIEGSTALVTGSNRGIGRAITEALAAKGATVLAGVRSPDADHGLEPASGLEPVRLDLSSRASVEESVRGLEAWAEQIDLLVNNAGVFEGGLLEHQDPAEAMDLLQVNLAGPIHLTRLLLPAMTGRDAGKIVNNTSIVGHVPFPGATVYAASKSGFVGFTESLRRELEETGVSVLELITPGVDTDMMDEVQGDLEEHADTSGWDHVQPEDWAQKVVKAIEDDEETLGPGGREGLAMKLPKPLMDLAAKRSFSR